MLFVKRSLFVLILCFFVSLPAVSDTENNFVNSTKTQGIDSSGVKHANHQQEVSKLVEKETGQHEDPSPIDPTVLLFVLLPLFILLIRVNSKHN